ncbi:hypothetical protein QR680_016836 [Steinernema hermaphroditum]|uniref:Chromo domain-containing protein n=1 Tax=Steinernema hermaphroditum TaxID=289476 RepID=A0AA39HCF1_9BILA|nr:hypothetical protein QR680_016836 [Steinernema hermaphroditum]
MVHFSPFTTVQTIPSGSLGVVPSRAGGDTNAIQVQQPINEQNKGGRKSILSQCPSEGSFASQRSRRSIKKVRWASEEPAPSSHLSTRRKSAAFELPAESRRKPKREPKKRAVWDVEKVIGRRVVDDEVQYRVKWFGWDDPTWQSESDFVNTECIEEYHQRVLVAAVRHEMERRPTRLFDEGAVVKTILGGEERPDGKHLVVQYEEPETVEVIPIKQVFAKYPTLVFAFLERILVTFDPDEEPVPKIKPKVQRRRKKREDSNASTQESNIELVKKELVVIV